MINTSHVFVKEVKEKSTGYSHTITKTLSGNMIALPVWG